MAWSQVDLDRINEALSSGVLEVRLDDRTLVYQSVSQMIKAKREIEKELAENDPSVKPRPRAFRARFCKGL